MKLKLKFTKLLFFTIGFCVLIKTNFVYANNLSFDAFSFDIIYPSQQTDNQLAYFDLLLKENEEVPLTILLTNSSNYEKEIKVTPTNAITNDNGKIDYSIKASDFQYDATLKFPFTSLVDHSQQVNVPPKSTKKIIFNLHTPKEFTNGIILGGFVAEDISKKKNNSNEDTTYVTNVFQLSKAAVLRIGNSHVDPEIHLDKVFISQKKEYMQLNAVIQNIKPVMFGQVSLKETITKKDDTSIIFTQTTENVELAPNSNFTEKIPLKSISLTPGSYNLKIVATSGNKSWDLTKDFVVSDSNTTQKIVSNLKVNASSNKKTIIIFFVSLFSLLVVRRIIIKIYQHKRNHDLFK